MQKFYMTLWAWLISRWAWLVSSMLLPLSVYAQETQPYSATSSLLKMVLGLLVVLAVLAAVAWLMKRFAPHGLQAQSVATIVGGVSVGARERVVVVEIAGRWIVVGVAPGQVTALADIEANGVASVATPAPTEMAQPQFVQWLKQSLSKNQTKD